MSIVDFKTIYDLVNYHKLQLPPCPNLKSFSIHSAFTAPRAPKDTLAWDDVRNPNLVILLDLLPFVVKAQLHLLKGKGKNQRANSGGQKPKWPEVKDILETTTTVRRGEEKSHCMLNLLAWTNFASIRDSLTVDDGG